jgi:uncharacterized protein (DUF1501 family)
LLQTHQDAFFDGPVAFLGDQPARRLWRDAARRITATQVHKQTNFADEVIGTELDNVLDHGKDIATALADARRLLERGVRCVQVYHRAWDHHRNMEVAMPIAARETDAACAALLDDLEQRGMLDSTLVVWGGEFGRTPMGQGTGRDHHINAFSIWMAGGGIKGGTVYGATDELGYRSVQDVVTVHDLHATVLHLFGIDHERFSVKFQGLDARLTGVEPAKVVRGVLA